MSRKRATFPSSSYSRPSRIDRTQSVVTVLGESGELLGTYDFGSSPTVGTLRDSFIQGFIKATGSGGRWRTAGSCRAAKNAMGGFLNYINSNHPTVDNIGDITPEVWNAWRDNLESRIKWPGQINLVRALLTEIDGVPKDTLLAIRTRAPKPKSRTYNAYSYEEFVRIRRTFSHYVRMAEKRITTNVQCLIEYWDGRESPDDKPLLVAGESWSRGQILDHLANTGGLPESLRGGYRSELVKKYFGLSRKLRPWSMLFPSPPELIALLALFICERGFNSSVVLGMEVPELVSGTSSGNTPSVYAAHLDKPRRGPAKRYFTSNFYGSESRLMESAIRMTQPCRYTLDVLGAASNQLFIARAARPAKSSFLVDWQDPTHYVEALSRFAPVLGDDGTPLRLDLRRLRLTEQVHSQRSRQNSEAVSEEVYRRTEPAIMAKTEPVILQGQNDALLHAEQFVEIQTLNKNDLLRSEDQIQKVSNKLGIATNTTELLLNGKLDTSTAACTNFYSSPYESDQSGACRASFMMCLGCTNAVATPRHLPQLVALFDALQTIASTVSSERWNREFAVHNSRLGNLLSRLATESEIDDARRDRTEEVAESISRLIERELDV